MRGENRSIRGKTSHGRVENQQTLSTYDTECGNRTRATLVEGKCSHHYVNPATINSLLSYQVIMFQEAHMYPEEALCRIHPCMRIKYFEPYITIAIVRNANKSDS